MYMTKGSRDTVPRWLSSYVATGYIMQPGEVESSNHMQCIIIIIPMVHPCKGVVLMGSTLYGCGVYGFCNGVTRGSPKGHPCHSLSACMHDHPHTHLPVHTHTHPHACLPICMHTHLPAHPVTMLMPVHMPASCVIPQADLHQASGGLCKAHMYIINYVVFLDQIYLFFLPHNNCLSQSAMFFCIVCMTKPLFSQCAYL